MFINLMEEGVKVTASQNGCKHERSENKHRNNYRNIKYVVSMAGAVGQMNAG